MRGGTVRSHMDHRCAMSFAVLGLTFKPNTDDMRDAPSLTIVPALVGGGAQVRVVYSARDAVAAAGEWLTHGPRAVVVTRGSEGARLLRLGREPLRVPAPSVEVVDTVGAGDTFNGVFAVALTEGKSLVESARFASAAAAISVTRTGAQPSIPTRDEIEQFLSERSNRE